MEAPGLILDRLDCVQVTPALPIVVCVYLQTMVCIAQLLSECTVLGHVNPALLEWHPVLHFLGITYLWQKTEQTNIEFPLSWQPWRKWVFIEELRKDRPSRGGGLGGIGHASRKSLLSVGHPFLYVKLGYQHKTLQFSLRFTWWRLRVGTDSQEELRRQNKYAFL